MGEIPQVRKIRHLGSGSFGEVYKAALTALSCQHIIRYFGHYHISDSSDLVPKIQIITEYCSGGNLKEYLKRQGLCYSLTALYFKQLREALMYLHSNSIIHTDVKCQNIFLADLDITGLYRAVKLGDVDDRIFKRDWTTVTEDMTSLRGTVLYMSPEMTRKVLDESIKVGSATDWWSLGCVLYEMAFGYDTFTFENPKKKTRMETGNGNAFQTLKCIQDGGRLVIPKCCRHLKKAFQTCFAENPDKRANGVLHTELFGDTHDLFRVPIPMITGCCANAAVLYGSAAISYKVFEYSENTVPTAANDHQATIGFPSSVIKIWSTVIEIYAQPENETHTELIPPSALKNFVDSLEQLKYAHIRSSMHIAIRLDHFRTVQSVISPLKHLTRPSDVVTHLTFYNKHSPSYEYLLSQLEELFLPNLVHLAFVEAENVSLEADTFRTFPMLRILSLINCSFINLASNFLVGLKRLERFVLKRNAPPSASQLAAFHRGYIGKNARLAVLPWEAWIIKVEEKYPWLQEFLSENKDLISPKPVYTHAENGIYQTEKWPANWNMEEYAPDIVITALAFGQQNWSE